jgi:hypothetical protein
MVRLLELATPAIQPMIRLTADTDAGVEKSRVVDYVTSLERRDYERFAGQRFKRTLTSDHPTDDRAPRDDPICVIDVLIPTYTSRARKNVRVGAPEKPFDTIEVYGLAEAFRHDERHDLRIHRQDGHVTEFEVRIPRPHIALGIKLLAWADRRAGKDAVDIVRCTRVCAARGLEAAVWESVTDLRDRAKEVADSDFSSTAHSGFRSYAVERRVSQADLEIVSAQTRAVLARLFR